MASLSIAWTSLAAAAERSRVDENGFFFSSDITKSRTYTRLRDVGRDHFQVIHVVHTAPLELAVHPKATTYRIPPYSVDMSHMLLNLKPTKLSH